MVLATLTEAYFAIMPKRDSFLKNFIPSYLNYPMMKILPSIHTARVHFI